MSDWPGFTNDEVRAMRKRTDAARLPEVIAALEAGAYLRRYPKLRAHYYVDGLDAMDKRQGLSLTNATIRDLEQRGVIVVSGLDRYALSEEYRQRRDGIFAKEASRG